MSSIQYPEQIDYRRADLQKSYQDALDEAIEANPGVSLHNLPATDDMKFIRGQMDELDEVEKSLFGKKYLDTGSTVAQDIASLLDPDTFANRQAESKKSYQDSIDEAFEKTSGGGIQEIPATDDTRRYSEYDPSITEPYKAELEQAKEEYEAAYSQYQIAEENYYTVPDGDFQKAQDDYLAADTRLAEAEERVKQAEQDLQAQEDMATYTKYQEMIASLPENDRMAILHSGGRDFSMAYGYLLQKGYSREDINAMYETMKRGMNAQVSKRVIDSVYDYAGQNVGTGAVGFTGARVGNVLGGVTGTLQTIHDTAQHYFQGSPYHGTDPNGLGYLPSRSASAADQSISDAIEGEDGGIIRKGAAFVYRGAANAADNLTRMAIASATGGGSLAGAGINSALSFTQGFQGSYREAQEKGGSPIQGLLVGAVDGGMEVFTESRTFERWMNLKDPELIGQGVYAWLKSAAVGIGNEIAEEEASYIANTIADAVVMADKGESAEFIKSAVAAGKTPAEARWELVKKYAHEMAVTAADTAMSTLLMDGATGVVANHQYKRTYGGSAAELVQEGLESLEGTQSRMLAEQYQQKLDFGKSLSGYELRRLVNANEGQFAREESEAAENNPEVEDTIQEDYRDIPMQNEQEDYRYVPEQVEQEDYRYVPTQTERESKNEKGFTVGTDSEHGTTVISFEEVPPKTVQAALKSNGFKFSSKNKVWFGQQSQEDARRIVLEAGGELYRKSEQFDEAAPEPHGVNAEAAPDSTISSAQTADNKQDVISKPFRASDTYGTTLLNLSDGSTVETEITGIASNEPGKLMLNVTGQDSPVQASDISYADSGEASLYYYVNEMELMPDAANMIVEQAKKAVAGLDGTVRAEKMAQFSQSIYGMYSLGKIGVPQGKAMSSQFAGQLSENMAEVGYQLGRRIYQQNVQQKEASKQQRAVSQRARAATGGKKINGVQYDGLTVRQGKDGGVEIEGVTLNEQQKAGIQAAELLASIGMNVHVFQSQIGADGKPVGENGSYSMADGSIHIDLNAGNDGQGVMAYTIAHELTHFMEDQQPEQFRLFTDALFDALDMDMEAEIANKAEKLKRQQPKVYQNASKDKLMADARSEVIAEACETMLTDTDAAQRIAQRIQQKDASLWEKIVQWFKDLSQKLRDAYNGLEPDSQIANDAKKTIQQVDGLVQMWADMAVDAAENYRTADSSESVNSQPEKRYSLRDVNIDRDFISYGDTEAEKNAINRIADDLEARGKFISVTDAQVAQHIDVDRLGDYKAARAYLKEILKDFMGDSVYFEYNGNFAEAYLTKDGVNHSVGGSIKSEKIAIFQQFKNLVKNAEYAFSTKNEAHSNINKRIGGRIDWDCFVALAKIGDEKYPVVFKIRTIDKDIRSQIYEMASKKEADGSHDPGQQNKPLDALSDYGVVPSTSIAEIVAQNGGSVKLSSRDSDWNNLSDQQQEYFRNSKVRDDNGNLKVMYRGGNEEFTVFDRKKSKPSNLYGRGFYFTDSESHAKQYGNAKAFYLNIKNPLIPGQKNIKKNQIRKFLEAVSENEDYGLENYGYGSTVESVLSSVWGKGDFEMLFDVNQTAVGDKC